MSTPPDAFRDRDLRSGSCQPVLGSPSACPRTAAGGYVPVLGSGSVVTAVLDAATGRVIVVDPHLSLPGGLHDQAGGDFTGSMRKLRRGDRVYLDGAHGSVTLESHPGMGYVFVAAGVGVTPFLSMLATLADRGAISGPAGWSWATGTRTR
jgi:hypothetical protein